MATGNRIVAVIRGIDGNEPHIEISDQNFKSMKAKGGDICIVHKKTEEILQVAREGGVMITRGDIYYIQDAERHVGSEQSGSRPGIIVSNDIGNAHAPIVEVVYLTGMRKKELPTHVRIYSAPHVSTALCEQVDTVSKSRLNRWIGHVDTQEQQEIDRALQISLGLLEVEG